MDPVRRGAIVRGARLAAGAIAGVATLGRGRDIGNAQNLAPSPYPPLATGSQGYINEKIAADCAPDPMWIARRDATQPLRTKLEELYGHSGWSISCAQHLVAESSYLPTLKSTSHWWQCSVAMDRQKRKATAIQTLEERINKLMQSPLDKLKEMANEALGEFMAEMERP